MMDPETPTKEHGTMRCDKRECEHCSKHGAENLVKCDECGDHVWEWQAHHVDGDDLCEACY